VNGLNFSTGIAWAKVTLGHMGTCVQPGEGCGEQPFTSRFRYRQL